MQRIYLKDRSFAIDNLPSEAGLLVELIDLCNKEEASFDIFSAAIKKDAGLTALFLRLANSPLYRQWNEVTDLKRMLIVLGMKNVRKIIITSAVQNFFNQVNTERNRQLRQLWFRSLLCAQLAEKIALKIGYPKSDEAYLAGLLHQIGILLLQVNYRENYRQLLSQYENGKSFCELEQNNYGIDHCEVGATLVESWQLDSLLSDAIRFQHRPAEELINSPVLLKIVAIAGAMSSSFSPDANEQDVVTAEQLLRLPQDEILEALAIALDGARELLTGLGFPMDEEAEASNDEALLNVEKKQSAELAERIKQITLTHCFMDGESDDRENLVRELRLNFEILFNIRQLAFFFRQKTAERLLPVNDLKLAKLDEISFNTTDQNSILVKSYRQNQVFDTVHETGSISDSQVVRILGAECGCFLPVSGDQQQLGVLVIGSSRKELAVCKDKLPLIKMLLTEIGKKYVRIDDSETTEESISLTEFNKIVHEVKNPLTIINNYLYILGKKLDEDHPAKEEIDFIKEEMERIGSILAKARDRDRHTGGSQETDLNRLLDELNEFFTNSLYREKAIDATLDLDSALPILPYPENSLKQIVINLTKNAVEALPHGGAIELVTRDNCFQNGNLFVEIAIKDNGPGIPPDILRNLFKPVASTKKGHSGLGLSIVADLVQELAGSISCYSSQEKGTEFKILLPRPTDEM